MTRKFPFYFPKDYTSLAVWRWARILLMGISIRFFSDFIYSVFYQQPIVWRLGGYVLAILLALFILEGIRFIGKYLDGILSWEKGHTQRFLIQLLFNAILTLFVVSVFGFFFQHVIDKHAIMPLFEDVVLISTTFAVTVLVVALDLGIFFLKRWRNSLSEVERFKKESLEFRHEMLKTQVNPHFLFNSLNTLSSLVYEDQDAAYKFIRKLSGVYRNVLEHRNKGLVTVKEELEAIDSYIEIIKLRFGDKIKIELDIPQSIENHQVPPLILQLLIENAIKHNVVSTRYPLSIDVTDGDDCIIICNTLKLKTSKGYSSKIGLDNIVSHYEIVTDRKVDIKQTENHFVVTIPLLDPDYEGIDYRR